uniref:RING-type domain-containing protein n=1 Tax=viral metagenome TaxID=1070528 RepID=A0A6C0KTH5_9ZZZZ
MQQEYEGSIGLNAIYGLDLNEINVLKPDDEENSIGLNSICCILVKQSDELKEQGLLMSQVELLNQAIEINPLSSGALFEMALYEELENFNYEGAIEIYLRLLETDLDNIPAIYNLADLYEKMGDYENMQKYFNLSGEKCDVESYLRLAKFHKNKGDIDNTQNNLLKAIYHYQDNCIENLLTHFNCLELLTILVDCFSQEPTQNLKRVITMLETEEHVIIFKNKVRVFSRFQNIIECGVCLENKLNIDMLCGHEICCDCYKRVYLDCCPFCRIKFD